MDLHLRPGLELFVQKKVKTGRYSEVVRGHYAFLKRTSSLHRGQHSNRD